MEASKDDFLKKMQDCQLEILKEIKKLCEANNIKFYLAFGTALGAVRHRGFIPWDDDIDLYMRVEDVSRFMALQKHLPSNLFIQTRENDAEYGLLIARVRDSNTTLIEADHVDRDINHGVYVDIYPLFYCPESGLKMKMIVIMSFFCRLFAYNAPPMNKGGVSTIIAKVLLGILPNRTKKWIARKLYAYLTGRPKSKFVSNFPDVSLGKRFLNEWFLEPALGEFEGEKMPLPTKPEAYLTYEFGDYMQLPPKEKQCVHHNYLFADFEHSYRMYKGKQYCVND